MIGHQTIGGDANLGVSVGFRENVLKRGIVCRLLEQLESTDTPVQDMIGKITGSEPWTARHGASCIETSICRSRNKHLPSTKDS